MRAPLFAAIVAVAFLLLLVTDAKGAFSFTKIADTAGVFSGFGPSPSAPSINASDAVAFLATLDAGGEGLFTGSGGSTTTIVSADFFGPSIFLGIPTLHPAINASGVVAFKGALDTGVTGIYTGSGGPISTIADSTSVVYDDFGTGPAINASGVVAFNALGAGVDGVFIATAGGVATTIADSGPFSGFLDGGFGTSVAINGPGTVAFKGLTAPGPLQGIHKGAGSATTPIADVSAPEISPAIILNAPAVNDAGVVVFRSARDAGGEGIYTGSGGALTSVATTDGGFGVFEPAGFYPAINASGEVAFYATFDTGGHGIFNGPDPVADKIVKTGDPLDGSMVTLLRFSRFGLNDSGHVAFLAMLADGRSGIFVAVPAPLPGDFNDDGTVDAADLTQWQGDFGVDGGSDADLDGDSDGVDFLVWQQNFGATAAAPLLPAVPEPSPLALALLASVAFFRVDLRRRI